MIATPPVGLSLASTLLGLMADGLDDAQENPPGVPTVWDEWLRTFYPQTFSRPFGDRHAALWDWVWGLKKGERPKPFVAIWPRGSGKSTNTEAAAVVVAARRARRYALYICSTQERADDHVGSIGKMLESELLASVPSYRSVTQRMLNKYGSSKGWKRNRLRTASGFTVDALGLDTDVRGIKLDENRPDLIILDDLDESTDSLPSIMKKIKVLTRNVLPAGAPDLAILAVQNLIHGDGIFARLVDGRADFMRTRVVNGPFPALDEFSFDVTPDRVVLSGTPTWEGQSLEDCQALADDIGLAAFRTECQHEVDADEEGIFRHIIFKHCEPSDVPDLVRVTVWCDPAVTSTDESDSQAIQVDGIATDGTTKTATIYRLWSWEGIATPGNTIETAILAALRYGASSVGFETDQGGDLWLETAVLIWKDMVRTGTISPGARRPRFVQDKAGAGHGAKLHRLQKTLPDYQNGRIVHVVNSERTHVVLESALRRAGRRKPFDLSDATYWGWNDLRNGVKARGPLAQRKARGW